MFGLFLASASLLVASFRSAVSRTFTVVSGRSNEKQLQNIVRQSGHKPDGEVMPTQLTWVGRAKILIKLYKPPVSATHEVS
jgi:hypothetical protein